MNLINFSDSEDDSDDDEEENDELTVLTALQNDEDCELVFIFFIQDTFRIEYFS